MPKVINYGNELYHHGIKGQKWGVRNGPPYPLNRVKPLTYATDDYCYALLRSGNFSYDKLHLREDYDEKTNKISLAELHSNAFKELFDRPGYIYKLDKNNFMVNPENHTEYITDKEVAYIEKIKINNIWNEMQKYKDRYDFITYENPGDYWNNVRGGMKGYLERKQQFNNDLNSYIEQYKNK